MKVLLWTALTAAVFLAGPRQLMAAPLCDGDTGDFRTRLTGKWADGNTWEECLGGAWSNSSNIPGASSFATIQAVHQVTVGDGLASEIGTLVMEANKSGYARLVIDSGGSLTINRALDMKSYKSNVAEITLGESGSLGVATGDLIAGNNIVISGTVNTGISGGEISGDSTVTLLGSVAADGGNLTLSADVVFNGTASISAGKKMTFSGDVNDASSGTWTVDAPGARLNFTSAVDIVSAAARLQLYNGTLDIDEIFTFAGGVDLRDATIEVATAKTFTVNGRYVD